IAAPIYSAASDVQTSILFNRTEVEIHIAAQAGSFAAAAGPSNSLAEKLADALGNAVFSTNGDTMEKVVGTLLRERGETISVAESCTGGLIGRRLTEVPGSSDYFLEGAITYTNEAKVRVLGVSPDTLDRHGAVSRECAQEMAEGMLRASGTDHSVSVTGIAGPGGGS